MSGCRVSYVFFLLAVAIIVVSGQADVSIWNTEVTLTCPYGEIVPAGDNEENAENKERVTWKLPNGDSKTSGKSYVIEGYTEKNDGMYYCTYGTDSPPKKHYFYIKAKVCDRCVDLHMSVAIVVVFGDVLLTAGIVTMVYLCARQKADTAAPQRSTQARQARGPARGPTPPDPDYQPLNPATRSNDVYAHPQRR